MNKVEGILKKEKFKVIEGGRKDDINPPTDWLSALPVNTFFRVTEATTPNPVTQEFLKCPNTITTAGVELMVNPRDKNAQDFNFVIVDPKKFSVLYNLFETLQTSEEAEDAHSSEDLPREVEGSVGPEKDQ